MGSASAPGNKRADLARHLRSLIEHQEMSGILDAREACARNVRSQTFRVFHELKLIVFAPKDQHRNGNLRQQVRDLGREICVQGAALRMSESLPTSV